MSSVNILPGKGGEKRDRSQQEKQLNTYTIRRALGVALLTALLATPSLIQAAEEPRNIDPFEPANRKIFAFNRAIDKVLFRPVAKGYNLILPQPFRNGIGNFFNNLTYPVTIVNGFLQGKGKQGANDTARFLVNSTFGVLGLFDPATASGLEEHQEDFGLTFAHWGIQPGPYVVLPVFGPFTARSAIGIIPNIQVNPLVQMNNTSVRDKLLITWFIESRAALIGPDEVIEDAYDPYLFLRDAYLQNRRYLLEGPSEDEDFFDEEFDEF